MHRTLTSPVEIVEEVALAAGGSGEGGAAVPAAFGDKH